MIKSCRCLCGALDSHVSLHSGNRLAHHCVYKVQFSVCINSQSQTCICSIHARTRVQYGLQRPKPVEQKEGLPRQSPSPCIPDICTHGEEAASMAWETATRTRRMGTRTVRMRPGGCACTPVPDVFFGPPKVLQGLLAHLILVLPVHG